MNDQLQDAANSSNVGPQRKRLVVVFLIPLVALALSVSVFAPRLWLFAERIRLTSQWDRATDYLRQAEDPFRRDVAPPVLWRLLPPLVSHYTGLRGDRALVVPWLGILCATAFVSHLLSRRCSDLRFIFGGTLLFCTTSAVLTPVGWLGINDGWVWLGLMTVAFAESTPARLAAYLLCPWVDERFLLGLPVAWLSGAINRSESLWAECRFAAALLPYLALRIFFAFDPRFSEPSKAYLADQIYCLPGNLVRGPLGWWMGLRAAWLPAALGFRLKRVPLIAAASCGIGACTFLAADSSRNIALLLPVVFLGIFEVAKRWPDIAPRSVLILSVCNLAIPAAHVTYTKVDPIDNIIVELIRFRRPPH